MLNGWKRPGSAPFGQILRRLGATASSAVRDNSTRDQALLDASLEALNVARDSKALVVARAGAIVHANQMAAQLFGRSAAELFGRNIAELFKDEPSPGPGAVARRWESELKTAFDGEVAVEVVRQRLGSRLPDFDVYAFRDLRERREAAVERERQNQALRRHEEELSIQNARFDAAINNMSQGLAMFDAEHRLVVCNRLYAELYGVTPELVKPGTTIRQLLEYRHAKGVFGDVDFEAFARNWLAEFSKASTRTQQLADGRIILIVRRPMADGGLVSTTEDITERQKLYALLERQNLRFDVALSNMCQGLCMFDGERRLVIANDRYALMYGLTPERVRPGMTLQEILEDRVASGIYAGDDPESYINQCLSTVSDKEPSTSVQALSNGRVVTVSYQPMPDGGWVATHEDITERRRSDDKIAHMALHDALTDLPNRVLLKERLQLAVGRARRGEIVAIHLLDLDYFKNVNDTLGHPIGDRLLTAVADRLRALAPETATIARMGGDEFAIIESAIKQPAEAASLAQQVIEEVGKPYEID